MKIPGGWHITIGIFVLLTSYFLLHILFFVYLGILFIIWGFIRIGSDKLSQDKANAASSGFNIANNDVANNIQSKAAVLNTTHGMALTANSHSHLSHHSNQTSQTTQNHSKHGYHRHHARNLQKPNAPNTATVTNKAKHSSTKANSGRSQHYHNNSYQHYKMQGYMRCSYCGAIVRSSDNFCHICGAKLK